MRDVVNVTDRNSRVLMLGIDAMSLPFAQAHLDQLPALQVVADTRCYANARNIGRLFSR